jgi:hypothetical protein
MNDENKDEKWSGSKFFIGIAKLFINMSTVSWGVYTFFTQRILDKIFVATNGELTVYLTSPLMIILVSGWVASTVIMGCNLQKAVAKMIENAKINAEFKLGLQKLIEFKANDVIKAL